MIKTVIFDLDGTITNSEFLGFQLLREHLKQKGLELTFQQFLYTVGVSEKEGADYLSKTFPGLEGQKDAMDMIPVLFEEAVSQGRLQLKKGFTEIARYLKERNIRLAVASNSPERTVLVELQGTGVADLFDLVVTPEMVRMPKPFPDMYELIRDSFDVETDQCLVIEDSEPGLLGAYSGGFKVAIVRDIYPLTDKMKEYSIGVFDTIDQVIPVIEEME